MRIRLAVLGTVSSFLLAGGLLPGCGKEKTTPGLMLSFTSDMSVPKDVTAVGLYIRTRTGGVIYNNVVEAMVDASGNRTVRFPSTFAVLSNGSPATVRVQLIAYGRTTGSGATLSRKALVMRESTTGVPTDRLSLLRMPLLWINQGSVAAGSGVATSSQGAAGLRPLSGSIKLLADEAQYRPEDGYKSPCGENQAWIGGKCRTTDPTAPLPDFTEADKPGSPDASCFNVEACFDTPTSLVGKIRDDGTLDIGDTQPTLLNLALISKDEIGIKLPDGRFAISLDGDSEFEGYTISNGQILLSEAVRDAIKSGRATDLIATSTCAPKTPDVGNCGEWNPAANTVKPTRPPTVIGGDGGAPYRDAGADALPELDAGFDGDVPDAGVGRGEPQGPPEPAFSGLALATTPGNIFSIRDGQADGGFATGLRVTAKGQTSSSGVNGSMFPGPYRTAYLSFPATANAPWTSKAFVFAFSPGVGQSHIYYHEVGSNEIAELPQVAGFIPVGVGASDTMPVFVGPNALSAAAIGYPNTGTYQAFSFAPIMPNGETPTAFSPTGISGFRMGTSAGKLRTCAYDIPGLKINCSDDASGAPGIPVDIAEDNGIFALVVRPDGIEMGYEGIYKVSGGQFNEHITKQKYPPFHFEPAGIGATAATGPRNRIALAAGLLEGYVTTARSGGTPSQVVKFGRQANPAAPVSVASQLTRALEIEADDKHVYYVDYGSGTATNDGRIYRLPLK